MKKDLQVRFGVSGRNKEPVPYTPKILYTSIYPLSGEWISTNCTSMEYYPNTHEGVLNLRRGVISIGGSQSTDSSPFYGASYVTAVDLSGCEITEIGDYAFNGCVSLTSFEIPADITAIGSNAFNGCTNLTEVTCLAIEPPTLGTGNFGKSGDVLYVPEESVSAYKASSAWWGAFSVIERIGWKPVICYNAGSAVSSYSGTWVANNTDTTKNTYDSETGDGVLYLNAGVTEIGGTDLRRTPFYQKSDLVSVDLSESGITRTVNTVFYNCTGLTSVTFGRDLRDMIGTPFATCPALASISVASGNTIYNDGNGSNCVIKTSNNTLEIGCKNTVIPNTVTSIGSNAFHYCTGLTSITIPDSVTTIGVSAFDHSGLTSVTFPNSVTEIYSSAFGYCTGLTSVTFGSGLVKIGQRAFDYCTALTSVTIDSGSVIIDNYAFEDCSGLTSITLTGVTSIGSSAFNQCSGLTSISIDGVTSIGSNAFTGCTSLTSITIPDSVTSLALDAFRYCTGVTSVTIGRGVRYMGTNPFNRCSGLTSITVDSNNTAFNDGNGSNCIINTSSNTLITGCKNTVIPNTVTSIGQEAFNLCTGLTSITIPSGVTSIGNYAFINCDNLLSVTCEATTPPTLGSSNFGASNDTLYVPSASVSAYQSASAWANAFTTITAIPTPVQHTISYTTSDPQYGASAVDGNWVTNNTDTAQNTYTSVAWQYGNRGEGVLYLNSGVTTIGGGQSTDYSPFYVSGMNHYTDGIDLSDSGLTSIGDYGLYDCNADFDPSNPLVIPEGVTTIGDHGLGASRTGGSDCYYDLPSTLTSIASNGIYIGGSKGGIAVMVCRATTPPTLGTNSISAPDGLWELQVPAASVSAYQSSAWGSLGFSSITAIP